METLNQLSPTETYDFVTLTYTGGVKVKMNAIMEVETVNAVKSTKE